ncbi:MAG: hypothetical protein Q7S92_05275 [Candidatus Diapherotrites archaeon]|nr:hypothetical protein [Candidatus Diapherotrites archaeon]
MAKQKPLPPIYRKIIWAILFLFILWIISGFFFSLDLGVSQGSFRGNVIDAEYTGIIWKNYVFHVQWPYKGTFKFTVCHDNPNLEQVWQKVLQAQQEGKQLVINYQDRFFYWNWECNGISTPVTSVEIV